VISSEYTPLRKLERVRWEAGVAAESYGVSVGVRVNDAALSDDIMARLPYGWQPASSCRVEQLFSLVTPKRTARAGAMYRLYDRDGEVTRVPALIDALDQLESYMQIYVAEMAQDRVFLHAGVVGWLGQAIILPGRSYAGKTTLVRELMRVGATYYSDEYAVLDQQGLVHAFARPLAVRTDGPRQEKHPVETMGGEAGSEPIPVGLVVLSQYRPRARWRPEHLSPGEGLLELLNHTIPARRKPAAALDTLERVVEQAPVVRTMRGEARRAVQRLMSLIESRVAS
jgi:hypothetical protein